MQGAGDQLLAGAALAQDEHAGVGAGDAFEGLCHLLHLRRAENEAGHPPVGEGAQRTVLLLQLEHARRALHDQLEDVHVDRLGNEVEGAAPHGADRHRAIGVAAKDDDLGLRGVRQDGVEDYQPFRGAVGIGRQPEIEDNDAHVARFLEDAHGLVARASRYHLEGIERPLHLALKARVVLDQQDALGGFFVEEFFGRSAHVATRLSAS